jgi:hypothetical protein
MQEKRSRASGCAASSLTQYNGRLDAKDLLQGGRPDNRVAPALVPLRQSGAPPAATVFSIVCAQAEHS